MLEDTDLAAGLIGPVHRHFDHLKAHGPGPQQELDVAEGDAKLVALPEGTTLDAVVRALNSLGATPRDIIAIMQALKAAGALRAEIVVI